MFKKFLLLSIIAASLTGCGPEPKELTPGQIGYKNRLVPRTVLDCSGRRCVTYDVKCYIKGEV